jgi:hypothetical protein
MDGPLPVLNALILRTVEEDTKRRGVVGCSIIMVEDPTTLFGF